LVGKGEQEITDGAAGTRADGCAGDAFVWRIISDALPIRIDGRAIKAGARATGPGARPINPIAPEPGGGVVNTYLEGGALKPAPPGVVLVQMNGAHQAIGREDYNPSAGTFWGD